MRPGLLLASAVVVVLFFSWVRLRAELTPNCTVLALSNTDAAAVMMIDRIITPSTSCAPSSSLLSLLTPPDDNDDNDD